MDYHVGLYPFKYQFWCIQSFLFFFFTKFAILQLKTIHKYKEVGLFSGVPKVGPLCLFSHKSIQHMSLC